jgi:predicted AlkP superfamily phosphohydrolase/phosphomutase
VLVIVCALMSPPGFCQQGKEEHRPIVVIGWDGAAWEILDPLLEQGRLPTLQRLIENGRGGRLRSTPCFVSPPAWVSIYSGKNPGKTDIFHFGRRESDLPHLGDLSGNDIRAKRIWDVMSDSGLRCALVNVPLTYPAQALNGITIAGEFAPCVLERPKLFDIVEWDTLQATRDAERRARISLHDTPVEVLIDGKGAIPPSVTVTGVDLHRIIAGPGLPLGEWSDWFLVAVDEGREGWARISLRNVNQSKARLWLSHVYRSIEDMPGPITYPPDWADTLATRHRFFLPFVRWNWKPAIDHVQWLGGLCEDVLLREQWDFYTCVFLAPDHMQHLYGDGEETAQVLEALDRATGRIIALAPQDALIVLVSDHGFAPYERRVDVNAWLHANGLVKLAATGEVMPESSLAWSTMWSIYLNEQLWDRDRQQGIIDLLLRRLPFLRDSEDGDALIGLSLTRREDVYTGPYLNRAPHLVVVPSGTPYVPEFWDTKNVEPDGTRHLCRDTKRHDRWDHAVDGIMVLDGPGIEHAPTRFRASVYDIVPTLIAYAGLPLADDLDGQVLTELFESNMLREIEHCSSYEDGESLPADNHDGASLEERLQILGYVE